jgi:hypothetical protein
MAEGLKLYKHFIEQLSKLGPIKRAWFTTFNLEIGFFEKYILSALASESFHQIASPHDYEKLTTRLTNDESEWDRNKMEVRVFYDAGSLMPSGRQKQTAVQLHAIDVKKMVSPDGKYSFVNGVFHPKIILLESYDGECWMMVSSANLTISGWGRNREGFFCEPIANTSQARALARFFEQIGKDVKGFNKNPFLNRLQTGRWGDSPSKWMFHSSFEDSSFPDILNDSSLKQPLTIWSPYFAGDLADLSSELLDTHFEKIIIIPAKTESQKIRITENNYKESINVKEVSFKQERNTLGNDIFVHAKIWLTPKKLAIGSWNMTRSGMNISTQPKNNIEAGIIYNLSPKEYHHIISKHPLTALKGTEHVSEAELETEKEGLSNPFVVMVDLMLDWETMMLTLENPTYHQLTRQVSENDFIILPGIGKKKLSILSDPISLHDYHRQFLSDRYFEIESKDGLSLFRGFIREKGLAARPAYAYANVDDYLRAWINGQPEDKQDWQRLNYLDKENNSDEINSYTQDILTGTNHNDWFHSFCAFQQIHKRIAQAREYNKRERLLELRRIGRVLPGSLNELREHLNKLTSQVSSNSDTFKERAVYLWFLIEKANMLFHYYNSSIENSHDKIKKIRNIDFKRLFSKEEAQNIRPEDMGKWQNYLTLKLRKH